MAGFYTKITALSDSLGNDPRLLRLLIQLEKGVLTAQGAKELETFIGESFLQSLLLGYANQVDLLSISPSLEAVRESARLAKAKAASLVHTLC